MRTNLLQQFLRLESASGIVLLAASILAMLWANSPLAYVLDWYSHNFLFWINEGLMTVFFLLIGLELKRGYLENELSRSKQVTLSLIAALGGMLVPILIYLLINYKSPETWRGWATPAATDIAFALGILSLFGRRVPEGLNLFLLSLAIFDDIGAILIITLFYSHGIVYLALLQAAIFLGILYLLNRLQIHHLLPYLLVGIGLWLSFFESGIHPTIAGFLLGLAIPAGNQKQSPLIKLETHLHPWASYLIMPLFALANAGFSLQELSWRSLTDTVVLGIALGLFLGKQIGVFGFAWCLIRTGYTKLPKLTTWSMLYGVSILCGIGFTMSLFLGTLSFQNENIYLAEVRLGVIIGSILSGLVGSIVLSFTLPKRRL